MLTSRYILIGGEVLGELAIIVVGIHTIHLCANINKFELTTCLCHH